MRITADATITIPTHHLMVKYKIQHSQVNVSFNLHSDEKGYVLNDEDGEKLYGMSLPESIERAQAKPLFMVSAVFKLRFDL